MESTGIKWIETVLSKLGPRNRGLHFQRVANHLPTVFFFWVDKALGCTIHTYFCNSI